MANTGAHLVDRVLPDVPVRQFVLSLPFELRLLAAFKSDVLAALARIFVEVVFSHYRAHAKRDGTPEGQCGAVTFIQRFGGSLNLNVHFHTAFLDGVFTRNEQSGVRFHPASPPSADDLQDIARRVHRRATTWLARRGYIDDQPAEMRSNERPEPGAIEACAAIAMQRGAFAKLATDDDSHDDGAESPPGGRRFTAEHEGFNLHAGVRIAAGDDLGRERLWRYGARPAFALDRLRRLPDGRITFRVKYAGKGRAKHRVMTPLELMARLSALIPPPRYPLVRFHGALAPRSSWRRHVVPKPPATRRACDRNVADGGVAAGRVKKPTKKTTKEKAARNGENATGAPIAGLVHGESNAPTPAGGPAAVFELPPPACRDAVQLIPNVISLGHWRRLHDGALLASSPYVDWAALLRRTFEVDVLACPKCNGRLRVLAVITGPQPVRQILEHLGQPAHATPLARARDPTDLSEATHEDESI